MNESGTGGLLDRETMAARVDAGTLPGWTVRHFETFVDGLTGERNGTPFPCHLGTHAVENGDLLYATVGLEITFQPRDLFGGLTHDTPGGERARGTIPGRLGPYDGVCPHADLGDSGVEGDREWHQYLFSRDEPGFPDECPPSVTPEVTPPDAAAAREAGAASTASDTTRPGPTRGFVATARGSRSPRGSTPGRAESKS